MTEENDRIDIEQELNCNLVEGASASFEIDEEMYEAEDDLN